MPIGPKGERRPADMIGNAVHVMRIVTDEIEETVPDDGNDPAKALGKKVGAARAEGMTPERRARLPKRRRAPTLYLNAALTSAHSRVAFSSRRLRLCANRQRLPADKRRIKCTPERCCRFGALDHDKIVVPPLEAGCGKVRGARARESAA